MSDDDYAVELREDAAGWRKVNGPELTPNDPVLEGLTEQEAEDLVRSNWALQHVDDSDGDSTADEAADGGDESAAESDAAPGVDEWDDWNEEDWLDLGYQQRAEDVREGRVDDYLDEILECETSSTVEEAASERLDEITDGVR